MRASRLFLPGWGARAVSYVPGLPLGWEAWQPPPFGRRLSVAQLGERVADEMHARTGPVDLAGHSMGAALAILAAAADPPVVRSLTLVCPAGLPLTKPIAKSAATFAVRLADGTIGRREALACASHVLRSPAPALRLARAVRSLDLTDAMQRVRTAGVPVTVLACTGDTLVTPWHARRIASLCGGQLEELDVSGGHMWMFRNWELMADLLATV
jgi:pimeloyl-ACP methyl ester carboxylesterase